MNKDILTFDEKIFVNRLREKGICICSGNEGYWLADSKFEAERTCRRLEREIR